ncbi:MAG: hypothetical protein JRH20_26350 [Deltaproteobacteria bacterium]|nr:hypothetical protein [Deltaproteobacteria bacterium]
MRVECKLLTFGILGLCLAFAGCSDESTTPTGDAGPDTLATDGPASDTTPLIGNGTLTFTPTWGKNTGTQIDPIWRPFVPFYEADSTLVVMLCKTDDTSCEAPVLIHEVTATQSNGDPIQNSFGPDVTVDKLPEGTFALMIFADGTTSRAKGFAWDSGFATRETAWKGAVSEGDMMMAAESPATGNNPTPATVEVTLSADQPADLGTIVLSHLHERDISPALQTEQGTMLVAVEKGLRFVDLASYAVQETATNSGFYTYQLVDDSDQALDGVCGVIEGEDVVYVLYSSGVAYAFDAINRTQLSTHAITFANATSKTPCRGVHVRKDSKDYLFVMNTGAGANAPTAEGLWYADVTNIATAPVSAPYLSRADEAFLTHGLGAAAVNGDSIYFSQITPANATNEPAACAGKVCVFRATFDASGKPSFRHGGADVEAYAVMGAKDDIVTTQGTIGCLTSGDINTAGIAVASYQGSGALKDHKLLFVGGCLQLAVLDIDDAHQALDFNSGLAGTQHMDATVFGQGFTTFRLSPNGKTLWSVPSYKSVIHFDINVATLGDPDNRQTFNRHMALPLDLTAADLPGIDPKFATGNIDDHEGALSLGEYEAPADDPGVDLNHAHAVVYQMSWAPSTAGSTFQSASISVGPTFEITANTLWLRGSGTSGVSGLGKGGNVGVYDLATRQALFWSHRDESFYPYWQAGPGGDEAQFFGFDLTPEGSGVLATLGLLYLPPVN